MKSNRIVLLRNKSLVASVTLIAFIFGWSAMSQASGPSTQKVNRYSMETHKKIQLEKNKSELATLKANDPFYLKGKNHQPSAKTSGVVFEKEDTAFNKDAVFVDEKEKRAVPNAIEIVESDMIEKKQNLQNLRDQKEWAFQEMNRKAAAAGYELKWDEDRSTVIGVIKGSRP